MLTFLDQLGNSLYKLNGSKINIPSGYSSYKSKCITLYMLLNSRLILRLNNPKIHWHANKILVGDNKLDQI